MNPFIEIRDIRKVYGSECPLCYENKKRFIIGPFISSMICLDCARIIKDKLRYKIEDELKYVEKGKRGRKKSNDN